MPDYPRSIARINSIESVPRRIRAVHDDKVVVDTLGALYVWEWSNYPQFYLPRQDVAEGLLVTDGRTEVTPRGNVQWFWLGSTGVEGPPAGRLVVESDHPRLLDTIRFDWDALDHWYEEDEEIFVHPRNPYARVDALRSTRPVRVELGGVVLAESSSPVMVFETGLPTRYYLNRTEVRFEHLTPTSTVTRCPYKGTTTAYWSVVVDGDVHEDLVWSYDFPTRELLPIAGLVSFYNEKVDMVVDGVLLERPRTHFFD
ncbi:MAG: DUF427 domain-containing protein [Acidimicrobiales bacterium]|jgi:uncharacterized protein (DUF427 family)